MSGYDKQNKIRCDCGKWVAVERNGEYFVWCKNCKKEVKLPTIKASEIDNLDNATVVSRQQKNA